MSFSAGPLKDLPDCPGFFERLPRLVWLTCFGPMNNNPGCTSGYRLAPEAMLSRQDGRDCAKCGVLHLAWSSKAVLAGFVLSTITYSHTAYNLGFMKWRNHSGGLQHSLCVFQALINEKSPTQYNSYG